MFNILSKEFPVEVSYTYAKPLLKHNNLLQFNNFIKVIYIENGNCDIIIEDTIYSLNPGDIVNINTMQRYRFLDYTSITLISISFDLNFISAGSLYNIPLFFENLINYNSIKYFELLSIINNIKTEWEKQDFTYRISVHSYLLALLTLLVREYSQKYESNDNYNTFINNYSKIKKCLDFIGENYNKSITLAETANICGMNKTYFCTYFKKVMGLTFYDYIMLLRLKQACKMLAQSKYSISSISQELGFSSASRFDFVFKSVIGKTPREYRQTATSIFVG